MRYFLAGFVLLAAMSVWAADYNESVSAVSYNPSRLGAYSHLKIAQKAVLKGVDAKTSSAEVNVMTKGTVRILGGGNCTTTGQACHQIEEIAPLAGADCSNSDYCDGNVNANFTATLTTDSGTRVHGGSTPYQENLPNIGDSSYSVSFPSATGTDMELSAGTFTAGSSSKAFVKTLDATLTQLYLDVTTLIMNGTTLSVPYSNSPTFKIGGTTITNSSKSGSFTWKTRVDKDGKKATVLTMQ